MQKIIFQDYMTVLHQFTVVLGLCGLILITEVASVRSCQKLPPYPAEPKPYSSCMDVLLARAEPIRNGHSTSVIKEKKVIAQD